MEVRATTDLILSFETKQNQEPITQLDIQKCLYLIEGFHLALRREPLFDEDFQAWANGPVLPSVYMRFAAYSGAPIPPTMISTKPEHILSEGVQRLIQQVWEYFSHHDAGRLVGMTHKRGAPWHSVRVQAGARKGQKCDAVIPKEMMLDYFIRQHEAAYEPRRSVLGSAAKQEWEALAV